LIGFTIAYIRKVNKSIKESQVEVSDKELLEFINSQPDKIINRAAIREEFGLTKFDAGGRLRHFFNNGLLRMLTTSNGMKRYYTLAKPIDKSYDVALTDDPFMTVEDLMLIFRHNDYQVTMQELILCTGLPIKVIVEEMKYFEKEGVVKRLLLSNLGSYYHQKHYSLNEPYRSNPESYMKLQDANFELKEIYEHVRKV